MQNAKFQDLTPMLDSVRDGVMIIDAATGRIEHVNPFLTEVLGYAPEELLGKKLVEIEAFSSPAFSETIRELKDRGSVRCDDLLLATREGEPIQIELVGTAYAIGGRALMQCNVRDVTAGRQAEEALSKARDELRLLLDVCRMPDIKMKELSFSVLEECIRMSGSKQGFFGFLNEDETILNVEIWLGTTVENCAINGEQREFDCVNAGLWAEAIRQRKAVIVNDYHRPDPSKKGCPDGHLPINRLMSIPIVEEGKVTALAAVANKKSDYSESDCLHVQLFLESVWCILKRQKALDDLRASEERFRTVADFTYNWETWRDPEGRYLYISPACERTSGYSVEEFMNDPELTIKIAHPDDRARLLRHEEEHKTNEPVYNFDFRLITRNGEERWINHVCQAVFDAGGNSLGRRSSNRDITEQKRLEIKLETYNQKLEGLVKKRTTELEETNTAMKVLLEHRKTDKAELEEDMLSHVNELVLPYLGKLKSSCTTEAQRTLAGIVEMNLREIISPFLRNISAMPHHFSPQETQIAALVKNGMSSKDIASVLNLSSRTIDFHRENIRKKLGLADKNVNLRAYLNSIK